MLLFYDFEFNIIACEPKVTSVRWTLYYNDVGSFEAHMPLESEMTKIIGENLYVIVCDGDKSAIITGAQMENELVLYGRTCNWLLSKRLMVLEAPVEGEPGALCCEFIENAFSDVENFVTELWCGEEAVTFEKSTQGTVLDFVKPCLDMKRLGHSLDFDWENKRWVFRIIGSQKNDLIISESNKNAHSTTLERDILDYASCGYYDRAENGESVRTFYDSGEKSGIYRWEAQLSGESEAEAVNDLALKRMECSTGLKTHGIKYGEDYFMGDELRVQITKGALKTTQAMRVVGVELRGGLTNEEAPILEDL